jgi:transcriptional regulator with XRE-family HTH domain
MDANHEHLVAEIRRRMARKRWSANQLADLSGVSRGFVSEMLNGNKSPTLRTLAKIAEAFGVEVRYLV